MKIQIKAKHFKGNSYSDNYDCPLARAIKEQSGYSYANVGCLGSFIGIYDDYSPRYEHDKYDFDMYVEDKKKVKEPGIDEETVLREIEVHGLEPLAIPEK